MIFKMSGSEYELNCGVRLYGKFKRIWGKQFTKIATDILFWADTWGVIGMAFTERQIEDAILQFVKKYGAVPEYLPSFCEFKKLCMRLN